jgi:anti-sigma-K factor RskA
VKLLRRDLHFLSGSYALDALDDPERDRFEHHLHRCQSCGNEVRGFRETATRLAFAVSRVPPAGMRQNVLARAARTRQLPPVSEGRARRRPQPRTAWVLQPAVVTGVVGLIVVVVLALLLVQARHQASTATNQRNTAAAREKAIATVLNAPDARLLSARTSVGGKTTVVVSRRLHKIVVTTARLPALPDNKVYQLWLLGPPATRSAGLLPRPSSGRTTPVLATGLFRGDELGVTVEPAGGTKKPTTTPIVVIKLYSKT